MKRQKWVVGMVLWGALVGCQSSEKQVEEALRQNPELIFQVIEENPERFVAAVNKAVRQAQDHQSSRRQKGQEEQMKADLANPKKPEWSPDRLLFGAPKAPLLVVEYGDFQCPACAVGYQQFKAFHEKYKGEVAFVFKHFPLDFHAQAAPAALAFELIRRDSPAKAQEFYQEAFREPGRLESQKDLEQLVKKLGYDWKSLMKSKHLESVRKQIAEDRAEFIRFGFTGTPVFIVNGVALSGAQPLAAFEQIRAATTAK